MTTPKTLPEDAPSRSVRPGDAPNPAAARAILAREAVDATSLDDLGRFIAEQGWVWRLASGRTYPRCWAATVAPWISRDPWAESWGDSPAEALCIAVALTIQTPPPKMIDDGPGEIEE